MKHRRWTSFAAGLLLAAPLVLGAGRAGAQSTEGLTGTFAIAPGVCSGAPSGSYFRMILPSGGAGGPYVSNGDSTCADQTYSPLSPGTDGGLTTGAYQTAPTPAFDAAGNGLANRIIQPTPFFGVAFAGSTEQVDPQTGLAAAAPSITTDGAGHLSGSLPSFGATWNKQTFNQGAPKPDGSYPGNSAKVSGTYDPSTGAYALTWSSQIVGGPFDNFTGVWHLEGTFRAAGAAPPVTEAQAAQPVASQGSGAAAGAAGQAATAVADTAASDATTATTAVTQAASAQAALPLERVSTEVTTKHASGPPTWLVLLIAAAGIAGAATLLWLSRTAPRSVS